MEQSARRFGITVVLLTLLFRLFELGLPQRALSAWIPSPEIQKESETGRDVRSLSVPAFFPFPFIAESVPPLAAPDKPQFSPEDAEGIRVTGGEPDCGSLIAQPLSWNLAGDAPTVLILHTHATESYTPAGEDYTESSPYRTLDEGYNMVSIGDRVAEVLEAGGVHVIHDREYHDYPAYDTAYTHARKAVQAQLTEHPEIRLVLDLHRDASDDTKGQLRTRTTLGDKTAAQLMLVVATGNASLTHEHWQENLALGLKLTALLREQAPGICRPISLRAQRFNQDLSPGFLLVEVGAAGNTREEALLAAEELGKAILKLKYGTGD